MGPMGAKALQPDTELARARRRTRTTERPRADVVAVIAIGGALGAVARYGISRAVVPPANGFPWATFLTNLSGAFALGFFLTVVIERLHCNRLLPPFFAVGFLGSFTTFSTLAVESVLLMTDGRVLVGVAYTLTSAVAGLACAYGGIMSARMLPGGKADLPRLPLVDDVEVVDYVGHGEEQR